MSNESEFMLFPIDLLIERQIWNKQACNFLEVYIKVAGWLGRFDIWMNKITPTLENM